MITPQTRQAIDAAHAAGLQVTLHELSRGPVIAITSPAVTGQTCRLRLKAYRMIDPEVIAQHSDTIGLQIDMQPFGETSWIPYRTGEPAVESLIARWYDAVTRILHYDDPIALDTELLRADDWKTKDGGNLREEFIVRWDDRYYGVPRYGDLCLSPCGLLTKGVFVHVMRLLEDAPGTSAQLRFELLPPGGGPRSGRFLTRSPLRYPDLRKFGPKSLALLPPGALNAHEKLGLTAYQERIDAARALGPITAAHLDTL